MTSVAEVVAKPTIANRSIPPNSSFLDELTGFRDISWEHAFEACDRKEPPTVLLAKNSNSLKFA